MSQETETTLRDAQRYRWLRAQHWLDGGYVVTRVANLHPGMQIRSGENLDALIDSALQVDLPKTSEIVRLRDENERLKTIARRIVDARSRDHWNDLDDAVDDLLSGDLPPEQPICGCKVDESCSKCDSPTDEPSAGATL